MLTAAMKTETLKGLDPYALRSVRFVATDEHGDDLWVIVCRQCTGHGFDLDADEVSLCEACEGLGESDPMTTDEVRSELLSA